MIFKLSVLAAFVAPLVSALSVNAPSQAVTSGGSMTFTWSIANGDPSTFSVFLKNPSFNDVFGVANSVDATLLTLTIQVPSVPENQEYTIELVPIDNSQKVLAQSPPFNIGSTVTGASTSATVPPTASAHSAASSATTTVSLSTPRATPLSTPSGFGTTVSAAQSSAATSATAPASSGSGSAAPASSSAANSAALPVRFNLNMGVVASMALSVFAGAAVVAL